MQVTILKRKAEKQKSKKKKPQVPGRSPGTCGFSDTKKDMHFCISSSGLGC
jgi:hypothetical protein